MVNSIGTQSRLDPVLAVILSILTCGLASIYYEHEVASRVEKLIQEKKASGNLKNDGMAPPSDNLKNIVLYGDITR